MLAHNSTWIASVEGVRVLNRHARNTIRGARRLPKAF